MTTLNERDLIRNISVIAHVDHGKSTLTDSLVAGAGIISMESVGKRRYTDNRPDEIEKGITIKSTAITLPYECNGAQYMINLIDSPGHVDFSSEVTAALRVTDGALVVVDAVEGCRSQTETVLRQALQERIKPALMVNKLDRCIVELQYTPEECYKNLVRIIESANVIISNYHDDEIGNTQVDPVTGTVVFGSGKMGWAFTLTRFARLYSSKFGIKAESLVKKLWGDNYYCPDTRKWQKTPISSTGKTLQRGFCQFVLDPIYKLFQAFASCEEGKLSNEIISMVEKMGITLTSEERQRENKEVHRVVMQKFLPAATTLVEVIVTHLPSPAVAQKYRYPLLYTGPADDRYAQAIANCDPNGPLMVFISKMVPSANSGRFVAFGRVFSGTVTQGQKVRIMGPEYVPGSHKDVYHANVTRAIVMMGRNIEAVNSCSAGNVIGLGGIDKFIVKTCTLTEEDCVDAAPLRNMKFSVSAVVQVAVEAVNPSDISKLVEGLKRLAQADGLVQCTVSESGQHIVAGAGELHLEICLNELENEHCKGVKIKRSKPVVSFTETITSKSEVCLAKSANKLNRIQIVAEPLTEELTKDLESGTVSMNDDVKTRSRFLIENHNWDADEARKVWAMGPGEGKGGNILVDCTKGVDYLNDVRDYIIDAFQLATRNSVLSEEPMRGIRFNIVDIILHSDSSHRGARQITPMARKAFYACTLSASPRLMEPVYAVEIQTHESVVGGIYNVINKRRGNILGTEQQSGTPMCAVNCTVPVLESFGLTEELRGATGGKAFPQMSFDHWAVIITDPLETGSKANTIVTEKRSRKGLKATLPVLNDYLDRL
jgi:elongation factor 2